MPRSVPGNPHALEGWSDLLPGGLGAEGTRTLRGLGGLVLDPSTSLYSNVAFTVRYSAWSPI